MASWRETYKGIFPDEYLDSLRPEDRESWWSDLISKPGRTFHVLVVEDHEGRVVGVSLAGRSSSEGLQLAEVWQIYLEPAAWGRGFGRALFGETVTRLRTDGFVEALLWVGTTNQRARRFYEAAGWHHTGAEKTETVWGVDARSTEYRIDLSDG